MSEDDQWDAVRCAFELDALEERVRSFIAHTNRSMEVEDTFDTPFGEAGSGRMVHPMHRVLGVINSCRDGVFRYYGEEQYKQIRLWDNQLKESANE